MTNEQIKVDLEKLLKQDPLIQLGHVHIKYPLKSGLFGFEKAICTCCKDVNLTILEGEVLGLVGESGSGKSSVGKAIFKFSTNLEGIITYRTRKALIKRQQSMEIASWDMQLIFKIPILLWTQNKSIGETILEPYSFINCSQ